MLNQKDIQQQSEAAWNVWKNKWLDNCRVNKALKKGKLSDLLDHAKGKVLIQAAFGYSLSKHIDLLKKYKDKVEVMCCDKAFGYLMENGIIPTYCLIADASVTIDWIKGQDISKTILLSNVAANPEWTLNWKGPLYFYVNWDNIGTAHILGRAADCWEVIPASSNVSNAQVVLATQILNADYNLLTGYDYSWEDDGDYYASGASPKKDYMHHADMISPYGYLAKTSSNLMFSCNWLAQYLMKFNTLKVINCSERGILAIDRRMPLEAAIQTFALGRV